MAKKKVSVSKRYTPPPKKARSNISSKKPAPKKRVATPVKKSSFDEKRFQDLFKKEIAKKFKGSGKTSYTSKPSPQKSKKPVKQPQKKAPSKGSYKDKYIELLEKTVREHDKDIQEIKKVIKQPGFGGPLPPGYEAFPLEEDLLPQVPSKPAEPGSIEEEILAALKDIQQQMHARNVIFDELVHGNGKNE